MKLRQRLQKIDYRTQFLMRKPSPMAATIAPLCAETGCIVHVRPDWSNNVEDVVALISSFFPNTTGAPQVIFEESLSEQETEAIVERRDATERKLAELPEELRNLSLESLFH